MIRSHLLFLLTLCVSVTFSYAQKTRNLSQVLELKMPDGSGTNGASVAWHPNQKKYYASFAGNAEFPLSVFSEDGKRLSDDQLMSGFDARGLWYDPTKKAIIGNAYADGGWFKLALNDKGIPQSSEIFLKEMTQPEDNSVGLMDSDDKIVCFLSGQELLIYKNEKPSESPASFRLYAGQKVKPELTKEEDTDDKMMLSEAYNNNVAVYTQIKHAEFGLLNIADRQIELYDKDSGLLAQILRLPENAPMPDMFNFACANGIFWIFDIDNRQWIGYK